MGRPRGRLLFIARRLAPNAAARRWQRRIRVTNFEYGMNIA